MALAVALVLDAWKPFATGDARWVSVLVWSALCIAVTGYRNRHAWMEITESELKLRWNGREPVRELPVSDIAAIYPVKARTHLSLIVLTTSGELIPLPTPDATWWMWQGEGLFERESARLTNWLADRRVCSFDQG